MLQDTKWETSFLGSDPEQVTSFSGCQIPPVKRGDPIGTLSEYHAKPLCSSSQVPTLPQKHPGQKAMEMGEGESWAVAQILKNLITACLCPAPPPG